MLSIKENTNSEIIINKSKFITHLIKIKEITDVDKELDNIKKIYSGASHYCYAYILGNTKRFNDDGEPSGSAGVPILSVLESNNLNNILCVVIRYFGGIKLGAGGLIRAYRKVTNTCLEITDIIELVDGLKIKIEFKYDNSNNIDYLLKDHILINKEFGEFINYTFLISLNEYKKIYNKLSLYTIHIKEIENILIEN
ncbi:MAG: YigZ family protein [Bacilli bacterium]|nr:YigZ family protein [Bacilli bacterium]